MSSAWRIKGFLAACAALLIAPLSHAAPPRNFVPIKDDLWRAGSVNWWSLIYVTPDGIVLVDPINPGFAQWLKTELDTRFPGKPVRYIIYSHSHWDHVGGAAVFAGSHPHIIGQERVLKNMDGRFPHFPGGMVDLNNNGSIESEEIAVPTLQHPGICGMGRGYFETIDQQHTGHLTPAQWLAAQGVEPPDMVYSERMTLRLGGRTIELLFPGLNHADDGTVVYFPAERVAFSADFPADALVQNSLRSLPSACGTFDRHPLSEWIRSYKSIEALDFEVLAQGHGAVTFNKADLIEARQYFETLRDGVSAAMARGLTLEEIKAGPLLTQYKAWAYYDQLRNDNIEAAYLNLKNYP
jgi:glyoxylase-like metal-dependent hydrolase (beta-lactamase superfamily II)